MQSVLAPLRYLHREIYLLGWSLVPAVLSKFRMGCFVAIAVVCLCAATLEVVQGRRLAAAIWVASCGLLGTGMRADAMLWGTHVGAVLGAAAIALAFVGVAVALFYELKAALREARRERRKYRRIPGTPGAVHGGELKRAQTRPLPIGRRRRPDAYDGYGAEPRGRGPR